MAPRASWKGFIKVAELTCPVALFTAASTSDRIAFHTLNRKTGHRVQRQFVDQDTGKPVAADAQVKGYEVAQGDYVVLEPDEIAAAVPENDKTLAIDSFILCGDIDDIYFDRPYYLAPADRAAQEAFAVLREGMRANKVAALARAVLFRRVRTVLIRPQGSGLIATTLNFDYEVRASREVFADISATKIQGEMLALAKHIIATKKGTFDPRAFDDRYEAALAELVKAKLAGKPIQARKPKPPAKVVDLMAALRQSAGIMAASAKTASKKGAAKAKAAAAKAPPRRKAG